MSYEINGKKYSYDYEDLLSDLKEDIAAGDCQASTIISIVREEHPDLSHIGYKPIVDYYLPMDIDVMDMKLEDIYNRDEFSDEEWNKMEMDRLNMVNQFKADKEKLEKATVTAVLTEMEQWNSVI